MRGPYDSRSPEPIYYDDFQIFNAFFIQNINQHGAMPELLRWLRTRFCSISPGQQVSSSTIQHYDVFIDAYNFDDSNVCRMRPDTEADRAARAAAASAVSETAKSRLCPPLSRYHCILPYTSFSDHHFLEYSTNNTFASMVHTGSPTTAGL